MQVWAFFVSLDTPNEHKVQCFVISYSEPGKKQPTASLKVALDLPSGQRRHVTGVSEPEANKTPVTSFHS